MIMWPPSISIKFVRIISEQNLGIGIIFPIFVNGCGLSPNRIREVHMSSRDELVKQIVRDQFRVMNSYEGIHQQILESHRQVMKAFGGVNPLDAINKSVSGFALDYQKTVKHVEAIGRQMIADLKLPSINQQIVESLRHAAMLPSVELQSQVAQALAGIAKSIGSIQADEVAKSLARIREDISRVGGIAGSAGLAALRINQKAIFGSLDITFARTVAESLKDAFTEDAQQNDIALARVEQLIEDKVATLPHNQVAAEGLWRMVVDILILLLAIGQLGIGIQQLADSRQSSNAQAGQLPKLINLLRRIANNTEELVPKQDEGIYYAVERQVELKSKPKNSETTVSTLFPNQKVLLVQRKHRWIYVQYFDYLDGVPKYGWVNKKYLKRLDMTDKLLATVTLQSPDDESGNSFVLKKHKADQFFNATQQRRLIELIKRREVGAASSDEEKELECLIEAELDGARRRAGIMVNKQ